jgi:hypothetical protein
MAGLIVCVLFVGVAVQLRNAGADLDHGLYLRILSLSSIGP